MSYKSKHIGLVTIADGNTKLGTLPVISTRPGKDCGNCSECINTCYAIKAWRQYPETRAAWTRNGTAARINREQYFADIDQYLARYKPRAFRWHGAGDILDQDYYRHMCRIARKHPGTKFLAFTKMFHLDYRGRPSNLVIVLSMWPGAPVPNKRMPRAWMVPKGGSEPRVPANAVECHGTCEQCGMCWDLVSIGRDVVFHEH